MELRKPIIATTLAAAVGLLGGCAGAPTLEGKVVSIDEQTMSWDGLRLSMVTLGAMESSSGTILEAGQELVGQDLGADHQFSLELPDPPDDRWLVPVVGISVTLSLVAYNDANHNGRLDGVGSAEPDPHVVLMRSGDRASNFVYAQDPDAINSVSDFDLAEGWNYAPVGSLDYQSDLDGEWNLEPATL